MILDLIKQGLNVAKEAVFKQKDEPIPGPEKKSKAIAFVINNFVEPVLKVQFPMFAFAIDKLDILVDFVVQFVYDLAVDKTMVK